MSSTYENILAFLKHGRQRPSVIAAELGVSSQVVHRQLLRLVSEGKVVRGGVPPTVFYQLAAPKSENTTDHSLSKDDQIFLDLYYLYTTPDGRMLHGAEGLKEWAARTHQKQPWPELVRDYIKTRRTALALASPVSGLLHGVKVANDGNGPSYLDGLYFSDFYSLPRFGKTRLGQLMFYAKQSQNPLLMRRIAMEVQNEIRQIIHDEKVNLVTFVPPSIERKIQFLKRLKWELGLKLPEVRLEKQYQGEVRVAQKTLKTLEERIENARSTIQLNPDDAPMLPGKTVLIIDDALGSGATLNEVAAKLKQAGAERVIGYAIVGSMNGFEVIQEA